MAFEPAPIKKKWVSPRLVVLVVGYLVFASLMLTRFPRVWLDTSWTSIGAYQLATAGRLANPIYEVSGFDWHILTPQIFQQVLLAGVFRGFGLGVVQGRLLSVLAGLALMVTTYFFARRYCGDSAATIAAAALAVDNIFFLTARAIRPDIFAAALSFGGYCLALHALASRSSKAWAASGLCVGFSLYTHPNSLPPLLAILLLLAWHYRLGVLRTRAFWIFGAACLAAFAPYAVYVVQADGANGFATFFAQLGARGDFSQRDWLMEIVGELERYRGYVFFPYRLAIALIQVAALVYGLVSARGTNRWLALFVVLYIGLLPVWNPANRTPRYLIMVVPALSILIGQMIVALYNRRFGIRIAGCSPGPVAAVLLLIAYFGVQAGADGYQLWRHRTNDFTAFCREVRRVVPPGSRIWANLGFWIGLHDYPYRSQLSSFEDVVRFRPEYVLLYDADIWGGRSATLGRKAPSDEWNRVVARDMEQLCRQRGTLVRRLPDKFYGDIEIYRLDWDP